MQENALWTDIEWLKRVINYRFKHESTYLLPSPVPTPNSDRFPAPPELIDDDSNYVKFITDNNLIPEERLLLALLFFPILDPRSAHHAFSKNADKTLNNACEVGLVNGQNFKGSIPSGLTFVYLLAGNDPLLRRKAFTIIRKGTLLTQGYITFQKEALGEAYLNSPIVMPYEILDDFITEPDIDIDTTQWA